MEKIVLITQDPSIPLRDVVFQTLREYIIKGKLKPGERLREISLSDQLGVSRTPVREAIHKLEREGLVDLLPRRGALVAKMTEKKIKDVLEIRRALEILAGRLACQNIEEEALANLKEIANEFKASLRKGDENKKAAIDERFHEIIYMSAGNELLVQMLHSLKEKMYLYRLAYIKNERSHSTLIEEHNRIIEALSEGNEQKIEDYMRAHIKNQEKSIINGLRRNEF